MRKDDHVRQTNDDAAERDRDYAIEDAAELTWQYMHDRTYPRRRTIRIGQESRRGSVYEGNLRDVVNELFPDMRVTAGTDDRSDPRYRRAVTFHANVSAYLKYTHNTKLLRRGGSYQSSQWWVADAFDRKPYKQVAERWEAVSRQRRAKRDAETVDPGQGTVATGEGETTPRERRGSETGKPVGSTDPAAYLREILEENERLKRRVDDLELALRAVQDAIDTVTD